LKVEEERARFNAVPLGGMESRAQRAARYRAEAERVRQEAGTVRDESVKQQLLTIATMYQQMAGTLDRLPASRSDEHDQ
jgi:hypothetical protein